MSSSYYQVTSLRFPRTPTTDSSRRGGPHHLSISQPGQPRDCVTGVRPPTRGLALKGREGLGQQLTCLPPAGHDTRNASRLVGRRSFAHAVLPGCSSRPGLRETRCSATSGQGPPQVLPGPQELIGCCRGGILPTASLPRAAHPKAPAPSSPGRPHPRRSWSLPVWTSPLRTQLPGNLEQLLPATQNSGSARA